LKRDLVWLSALVVAMCGILLGLGFWQLQRMAWKDALNEQIAARTQGEPVSLADALSRWEKSRDVEYLKVQFKGRFRHGGESHFFTVIKGQTGWRVVTPLETNGGRIVMVDRGFVPDVMKNAETRTQGQVEGEQAIIGLARAPGIKAFFVPENAPEKNNWFWRDLNGMAVAALPERDITRVVPFFVEQEVNSIPGGLPRGGVTRIVLPNTHLQYVLTWFGLAGALLAVFAVYLRGRFRRHAFT
jgi:surfeit locus 1 family protein